MPEGEHVEEVDMMDFDQTAEGAASGQRSEAYHEDGEDETPGMRGMPCAQQ